MTKEREASQRKARSEAGLAGKRRGSQRGIIPRTLERSTAAVEKMHRAVVGFVFDALGRLQLFEKPVARVRKLQDRSITATYDVVRGVNREVDRLLRKRSVGRQQPSRVRRMRPAKVPSVARAKPAPRSVRPAEPAPMTGTR